MWPATGLNYIEHCRPFEIIMAAAAEAAAGARGGMACVVVPGVEATIGVATGSALTSVCRARFARLPRTFYSRCEGATAETLATLRVFLWRLSEWEPGLVDMIACCVLDRLVWEWIPPRPPRHLLGRLSYRDVLYREESLSSDGLAIDAWCCDCDYDYASLGDLVPCPLCGRTAEDCAREAWDAAL